MKIHIFTHTHAHINWHTNRNSSIDPTQMHSPWKKSEEKAMSRQDPGRPAAHLPVHLLLLLLLFWSHCYGEEEEEKRWRRRGNRKERLRVLVRGWQAKEEKKGERIAIRMEVRCLPMPRSWCCAASTVSWQPPPRRANHSTAVTYGPTHCRWWRCL